MAMHRTRAGKEQRWGGVRDGDQLTEVARIRLPCESFESDVLGRNIIICFEGGVR